MTIDLSVPFEAPKIVYGFATHCHGDDESEGSPIRVEVPYSQLRNELATSHHQEEHVQEELELVVKHQRNKRDHTVLLIADHVRGEFLHAVPTDPHSARREIALAAAKRQKRRRGRSHFSEKMIFWLKFLGKK